MFYYFNKYFSTVSDEIRSEIAVKYADEIKRKFEEFETDLISVNKMRLVAHP